MKLFPKAAHISYYLGLAAMLVFLALIFPSSSYKVSYDVGSWILATGGALLVFGVGLSEYPLADEEA